MTILDLADAGNALAELDSYEERKRRGEELKDEAGRLAGDLRQFIRAAWHILEPTTVYHHGWHIDAIAEHLEAAYKREIRRLVINVPPRHMKSLTVSTFGPAWRWTHEPGERFLTASYDAGLATEHAVNTRTVITSPWYRNRWGHVFSLTGDQNVKSWYVNDRRGYRYATSVGGGGTGRGGDVIVIDDPHNAKDAVTSPASLADVITWHDQTLSTRFNDPETGVEILVMQRLHEGDLTGHVLEKGGWTHLCLPAEYEPKLVVVLPRGTRHDATTPPVRELPSGRRLQGDPRDMAGEPLWPTHFTPAALADLKAQMESPSAIAGQLQQRPAPAEGALLKRAWWRFYGDVAPTPRALVQSWDTALKDKTANDFTVGHVWGVNGARRYLLRKVKGRWDLPETLFQVRSQATWVEEHYPHLPHVILVENTANGPEVIAKLRGRVAGIIGVNVNHDKTIRAQVASVPLEAGNVLLPGPDLLSAPAWALELVDEAAGFPNAAHDDDVDAFTQALNWIKANPGRFDVDEPDDRDERRQALSVGVLDRIF